MLLSEAFKQNNPVVYLVEPDQKLRTELTALLEKTGFAAVGYANAEELLQAGELPMKSACVVSEMKLPGMDGIGLLNALRESDTDLPFIILTGDTDVSVAVSALHSKVTDYLVKPVIERDLIHRIKLALRTGKNHSGLNGNA